MNCRHLSLVHSKLADPLGTAEKRLEDISNASTRDRWNFDRPSWNIQMCAQLSNSAQWQWLLIYIINNIVNDIILNHIINEYILY